ncbi:MAG: helix-turn-helix domain containing protein [Desulfovibrionaceae bacterium]|nr:helix-turn-helix domain containing protein [Desulfovibrionaceae bacterium]
MRRKLSPHHVRKSNSYDRGNPVEDFEEIFARIQSVTRTKTQEDLAKILGIRQSSISDTKSRKTIPSGWYLTLFDTLGVNPHWLRRGSGPVYLRA